MTEIGQVWAAQGPPRAWLDGDMGSARAGRMPVSCSSGTAVPPRRSTARPRPLCPAVTSAGSCDGRDRDRVEGLLGADGVVPVGLGQVVEASVAANDGDGHVGEAGEIAR